MAEQEQALWLHAEARVTIVELAQASGLTQEDLRELVEYGALAPADGAALSWSFGADCVVRVRAAARLREALELDTSALALVLTYLERIQRLEAEVRHLRASRLR